MKTALRWLCWVGFLGLFGVGVRADNATLDDTKTRVALPLTVAPFIDGVIGGSEWERAESGVGRYWRTEHQSGLADSVRGADVVGGAANAPADSNDLSADFFAGFDATDLYIAVRVKDSAIQTDDAASESVNEDAHLDDGVTLFIDGDNSNFATEDTTGTNPEIIDTGGPLTITANNAYRETEAGNPGYGAQAAWHARTTRTGDGYDVEFRVSLAALGDPQPGEIIGFTILINDDDDGGELERQVIWTGTAHVEASYGNLILGTKSYEAPRTATPPTIDGQIGGEEYAGAEPISVTPHTGLYDVSAGDDDFTPDDHRYTAWITHDDTAIYVAVDVTDDILINDSAGPGTEDGQTWIDDGVEIFFDADESNLENRPGAGDGQRFDGQYVFNANGARRDAEANHPQFGENADWFAASTMRAGGYTVEFCVKRSALPAITDDTPIGFNICINDDDAGGPRKCQLNWSGRPHNEFTYGALILSSSLGSGLPGLRITEILYDDIFAETHLTFTSRPGRNYGIQRSINLADWGEIDDLTGGPGSTTSFTDDDLPPGAAEVFYRVVELD